MTLREPRLWEYHNELAGGTGNAYRQFGNEGLDRAQRFHELRAFHDRHVAGSGLPLYVDYGVGDQQMPGTRLAFRRRVESLDDTHGRGHYERWFLYTMADPLPWAPWVWVPEGGCNDMRHSVRGSMREKVW